MPYRYFYEKVTGTGKYDKFSKPLTDADKASLTDRSRGGTITNIENSVELANILNQRMKDKSGGNNQRLAQMLGWFTNEKENPIQLPKENTPNRSKFSQEKYGFFLEAPFEISNKCCNVMKKKPAHDYSKRTGRWPITAQMADESRLRLQKWIQHGCNGFDMKSPISNPMSFWTEQDVLKYIKTRNLPICSVYGDVVEDYEAEGLAEGQMTFNDFSNDKIYKTTGCSRTGCMLCGFGCHMADDTRFLQLKETHPKMYNMLDVVKNNGVTFREAIEWTNEHGNLNIKL